MENIKMEDIIEAPTSEAETVETEVTTEETTEQDLLKDELEKVQNRSGRTEIEKAEYSLKKNAERFKDLGGDPASILGVETIPDDEDDAPVTVGMLKKFREESATKSALQLANEIPNKAEAELVKFHIKNSIKPTGNPAEDLRLARGLANIAKNTQIIEETRRKSEAKSHSSSSGAPAKTIEQELDLTPDELSFMRPPFNLTKEEVIKARKK